MAVLCALCALFLFAGSHLQGNGNNLFWKDGKVTLRVSRAVYWDAGDGTGVDGRESAASVHAAIFEAIRSWVRPGRANLELDLDFTDATSVSAGVNIVTFTDPAPFDTGVCHKERFITCTILSFTEDGAIASASVAFNPYKRHSSLGLEGTHDLGLIMMHEMGHTLGLDHSFLTESVMTSEAGQEPVAGAPRLFAVRRLAEDDLATLAGLYPLEPVSAIQGVVKLARTPVAGARVVAIDASGRVPAGVWSLEDGSYRLLVSPGEYLVVAEPADGPAVAFETAVSIAAGQTREDVNVNLSPAAGGGKPIVDSVGVVANGLYPGMSRVDLARGLDYRFALTRTPVGLPVELLFPETAVQRTGSVSSPASAPQLVRQTIQVSSEAVPGSYALFVRAAESITLLTAPLRVVTNPRLDSIHDPESGERVETLRSGRRYLLRGADFSVGQSVAPVEFEGAPPPTQLEGVALRLGDRFLPIVSINPAEMLFELPGGTVDAAAEGRLVLVTGSSIQSNPLPVIVAP